MDTRSVVDPARSGDPPALQGPHWREAVLRAALDELDAGAELAFWLWRAGSPVPARPDDPPAYARSIVGDWWGAAAAWEALGFPYERADALSEAGERDAQLEALATFDRLGAARAAGHLRQRLRAAAPSAP